MDKDRYRSDLDPIRTAHGITRQHLRGKAQCVLNPWSHDTTGPGGQASSQSALLTILSVPPLSNLCRTQQRTPVTRPITNNYATDTVTLHRRGIIPTVSLFVIFCCEILMTMSRADPWGLNLHSRKGFYGSGHCRLPRWGASQMP